MPQDDIPPKIMSSRSRLLPHATSYDSEKIKRYGTFGYMGGVHEYGNTAIVPRGARYKGRFVFNEAGRKLITNAFPGFSIEEILQTLNTEFEDPTKNGHSHGMVSCRFTGESLDSIEMHSKRGFVIIKQSWEGSEKQKAYAADVGKNVIDKIFEDLIPYLQKKAEENAHLAKPSPSNNF